MSVVKDLVKLRKYNIHEVNEQIHRSQNSSRIEDGKNKDQNIKTTNHNDQEITTTEGDHAVCTDESEVHQGKPSSHQGEPESHQASAGNQDIVKEFQGKPDGMLNETVGFVDSVVKEAGDTEKSTDCQNEKSELHV